MTQDPIQTGIDAAHMQAVKSLGEGGIPVGAALMLDGAIISVGHNRRIQSGTNILHGETDCIERAGQSFDLSRATLFTTLAPCQMCTGAILLFRIPTVIIMDTDNIADFDPGTDRLRDAGVDVRVIAHPPTVAMMHRFQTEPDTRRLWMGDIGK